MQYIGLDCIKASAEPGAVIKTPANPNQNTE